VQVLPRGVEFGRKWIYQHPNGPAQGLLMSATTFSKHCARPAGVRVAMATVVADRSNRDWGHVRPLVRMFRAESGTLAAS